MIVLPGLSCENPGSFQVLVVNVISFSMSMGMIVVRFSVTPDR